MCVAGVLVLLTLAGQPSEHLTTVTVTGVAGIIEGNQAAATDAALLDAQRLAVEQGAGIFVSSETRIRDFLLESDIIRTKAAGYLARYEIIERTTADQIVRLTIRADVRLDALAADLLELDAVVERLRRPRLMLVLHETDRGRPAPDQAATAAAEQALREKGFDLLDPAQFARVHGREALQRAGDGDAESLLGLATEQGVEVLVVGQISTAPQASPVAGMATVGATVTVRAFDTQTARVLASRELSFGTHPERPAATAATSTAASRTIRTRAARQLMLGDEDHRDQNAFVAQLLTAWLTSPTVLTVTISGVPPALRQAVIDQLRADARIDEALTRLFADNVLTIELRGRASLDLMLAAAGELTVDGHRLTVTEVKGSTAKAVLK